MPKVKQKLLVLGGSGIGMIAASIAELLGSYEVEGFLNDAIQEGSCIGKFKKYPVLGSSSCITKYIGDENYVIFVAFVGMTREKETFEKIDALKIPSWQMASLIHPAAIIPEGMCSLGEGILVGPHAQLSPDTTIEDNCILLGGSFLGHDSTMKRFAHLATNAVIGANVVVGRASHIGSNATIREKVVIGDFSLVGAGSVVLKNVKSESIVIGNPSRDLVTRTS